MKAVHLQLKFNVGCARYASGLVPFKLADIGEGIAEVELLKWFVKVLCSCDNSKQMQVFTINGRHCRKETSSALSTECARFRVIKQP